MHSLEALSFFAKVNLSKAAALFTLRSALNSLKSISQLVLTTVSGISGCDSGSAVLDGSCCLNDFDSLGCAVNNRWSGRRLSELLKRVISTIEGPVSCRAQLNK